MQHRYELIVVGGGFAGTCAAIEAARHGRNVLLVEKYNCLGGAAANCLISPFMGYWTTEPGNEGKKFLTGDLFLEILKESIALGGMRDYDMYFDEEILKLVLNRLCIKYGVNLLFDATVVDVTLDGERITSLTALGKSRRITLEADLFVDATGDGELSMLSGCDFKVGREADGLCQPMTLCFRMGGVNKETFHRVKGKINVLYKEFQAQGKIKNPRENVLIFENFNDGVLHFNTTRIIKRDPTDPWDVTRAEIEAREQVFEIYTFLKENMEGFENARILSTALQIGIRESRKIMGEYVLTQEDLLALARFDDAIAVANYDIDIHNPAGTGTSHHYFKAGEWYEIPYRCLLPKGKSNLLVAGRCISSTHEAQASYRVMPFCAELGQAAGAAAALALETGKTLRTIDIQALRERLRAEGFVL